MASNTTEHIHEQKLRTIIYSNYQIRDLVQRNVDNFLNLREELITNSEVRQLTPFKEVLSPLIEGPRIKQLDARIISDRVQLALCGENSSGKTAFLHAFLGIGKILPSGDGPVTARITKLTYASHEQARICIRKSLRDQTLIEEVDLSACFTGEKPNWMNVGRSLTKYVKRPQDIEETSAEFSQWARCFVEICIPSPTLAVGIDVYDTPGFLLDDAPVLKEILHDLVELIHPTIVFMYANPSTDDGTKGCFLAMKTALYDLDNTSIFFLNSKADINQMPKFKQGMDINEFLSALADERAQRYSLLLRSPLLYNNKLEGLPALVEECHCFDLCSVNSQKLKPYGPAMNETTVQHIIQFVSNNDLSVATHVCKLVLPIIDAFFNLLRITSYRTPEQLLQLHFDAMSWENTYFQAYTIYTEDCLEKLFSNIYERFNAEEEFIVQPFLNIRQAPDDLGLTVQAAVRLQVIKPAIRDTLKKFMAYVFQHIASNCDLTRDAVFNEMLIGALGRQEISDFAAILLGDHANNKPIGVSVLYMVNTLSAPIIQCAQNLQNLNFSNEGARIPFPADIQEFFKGKTQGRHSWVPSAVRKYLLDMQAAIEKQRDTMRQAVILWGDQQKAALRSLIDVHYNTACPLLNSHQATLKHLEQYVWRLIVIECELCAAQDMAKFNGSIPEIRSDDSKSTMFSIFTADWGNKKNLVVKKLNRSVSDQPNAVYYEAHYHRKVASLCHPNIINLRYLYEHHLDNQISELWIIFPPMMPSLEHLLSQLATPLSIKTALKWMIDIADALTALHENEIVHRNVVLNNIVFDEHGRAMLIDLGNWYGSFDLCVRHDPSSTIDGTNDDIRSLGKIGQTLSVFIEQDEKVSTIIEEFNELILKCCQASHAKPMTAEFTRQKLKFLLDMF